MQTFPFGTVLIANRGEIAVRIIKTLRNLGLRSATVYHEADARTPAVYMADTAIAIGGHPPMSAYLDSEQIIAAARSANAGALHPGYGFLSESAEFARAVELAGITFVGPTSENIELMGDKTRARNFVQGSGFPVVPSAIEDDDASTFASRARALGLPLLIKPSAGGGGKGMRIVQDVRALDDAIAQARREARRYFRDGRLYAERYVERPHHIEVQVLGDGFGNVVHLFERECSVQRRFQKIIEETPSPALPQELRKRLCDTAVSIARSIKYRGAGTVEFILSGSEFYFLEMNTRLQVEHPVTEVVTGIDLVAAQLHVAAGHELSFLQSDIVLRGHAIEARLYAEAPEVGFAPTTGKILMLEYPESADVRIDSGIVQGQEITAAFDPLLAKIIAHASTRSEATLKLERAIRELVLLGCETNASFLAHLLTDSTFQNGDMHTGCLDDNPGLALGSRSDMSPFLAAAALLTRPVRDSADAVPALHAALGKWRN
ncbi:acetyl/propionyl/methylcrotonyl-CoA carboxylase subunit alpha [Bradyrhizobium sp. Cp5.3]|uniref:acetyl-CoA carboxylase biotin carboxylase subunit n=1 Tax=Bradyrhizobium sp. Cp5.3 TaxID=443598 RepID=UPI0004879347|nr:biotin carboxylase N-terminal domain-containing protein [Bradyrhizobium sp. Cp5.3]